jgi:putative MFS transporter
MVMVFWRRPALLLPLEDSVTASASRSHSANSAQAEHDVGVRLDRLPAARHIWYLVALVATGAFFEIYDLALSAPLGLGLTTVGIFHRGASGLFGLSDQATFIAATFAGLYLGTLGFSAVADRIGRRTIFTFALLWYSIATIIMGLQNTAVAIDAWRLIASVGAGLEMIAIDCYLAELTPKAFRGRAFAFCASIQYLSAPLVGILAWRLIPGDFAGVAGWRWLTFVPAVGAVLIWFVRRALPESPRWLAAHGRFVEAERVLARIEQKVAERAALPPIPAPTVAKKSGPATAANFLTMWRPPYRRRTIAMVIFHSFQTIGYFGFSNWLPTLLVSQGVTVTKSLGYAAVLALVPPIAPVIFGLFADKLERKWLIVIGALVSATFGVAMGQMGQHSNAVLLICIGAMVAAGNALMSLAYHTYQSEIYPTAIRARAVGFVYSFSRLSSLGSSYLIAFTLDRSGGAGVFLLISSAMLVVAVTIATLGPRSSGRSLNEI